MMPARPCIYHITHRDNLAAIISAGGLFSDATMLQRGGPAANIGMKDIKQRRLHLPVRCQSGGCVGDYVPFYFCPRSIMLYVIHCGNSPALGYRGGQDPIVHLVADLGEVIAWANRQGKPWAFSLSNAGSYIAEFRCREQDLNEIDWKAVGSMDFRSPEVKEGKQAEFLVHGHFPWTMVRHIGVISQEVLQEVIAETRKSTHQPNVSIEPSWYF